MLRTMRKQKAFLRAEQGSVMPIMAVTITALIGSTGVAIDMGRAQLVQSKLSSALDAAGLAAGSTVSTTNLNTEVNKYLNANFRNYMGATLTSVSASVSADSSVITLSATATLPNTFMKLFGHDHVTVSATSEITRESKGLELVMVLDNTGSMAGSKLTSLKSAATDLVNILYGSNSTVENLWIGLVPFSQAVNIGNTRSTWVTTDSFNWGTTSWAGCVDARETSNRDVTDDPPSVAKFPRYYWPCHTSYNAWYGTNGSRNNCNSGSGVRYSTSIGTSLGPNKSCPQTVTPMTASKSTILNGINAMQAVGNTHINLGAAWGWRMLSPRWRSLWGGEMNTNNLPLDYNTPLMNKAVIIMTDGDNTMDNSNRTAYWYLSDNKLGTTNQTTAESRLDTRLGQVCTSMKNNNIIVYTVSFGTISSSSATMLRNCATQSDYYFASPTSADLQTAFRTIGDSLANLRVSK